MKTLAFRGVETLLVGSFALVQLAALTSALKAQETDQQASLRRDADAAWSHRAATIKSLIVSAEVDQFEKGRGIDTSAPGDPFGGVYPAQDQSFKVTVDHARKQGKLAFSRSAPTPAASVSEATRQQSVQAVFDGQLNSALYIDGGVPIGQLNKKGVPDSVVGQHVDLLAINLWLQPQVILRRTGWLTGNVNIEEQPVETDGVRCRRLRVKSGQSTRNGVIDCDPKRGWVPIRLQIWRDGKLSMSVAIAYAEHEKVGPVIKGWEYSRYKDNGDVEERRKGTVKQLQVNCDIDDDRFTIKFPIGTQVTEQVGDKTRKLIQGPDGLQLLEGVEPAGGKAEDPFGSIHHQRPRVAARLVAFTEVVATQNGMTPAQLRAAGFTQIADADSLDEFDLKPWHRNHWTIKDGLISYDGKAENKAFQKNSLWTKKDFGDLQMYAEWRLPEKPTMKPHPIVLFNGDFLLDEQGKRITRPHLDAGDSGLMFRGTSDCQANIWSQELGSGEINGYRTNHKMPQSVRRACIPIKNADHPLGEWNTFLVTIKGNRMSVDTNGERVINEAELPDLPKKGPLGLQHHGDPVQFRQLWVKDSR